MSDYRLITYPRIETLANELEFRISHAAALVEGEPGAAFVNRIPFNRLFLIEGESTLVDDSFAGTESDTEMITLKTGRSVFLPADVICRMRFGPGLRLIAIHFSVGFPGQADLFHHCSRGVAREIGKKEIVKIRRMAEQSNDDLARTLKARSLLLTLVLDFAACTGISESPELEAFPVLARVEETIRTQPPAQWRVAQLADAMGTSADALSKRFQRETGQALKDYLTRELIRRSTSALLSSSEPVRDIAAALVLHQV